MRVAVDATSLLGNKTGVGVVARELIEGVAAAPDVDLRLFIVSWRGRAEARRTLPATARFGGLPVPARLARLLWPRIDVPPAAWLAGTGGIDVVHGPNFVVPPAHVRRRPGGNAELVTIHDLTCVRFPELVTADTLHYPTLIRRALDRGAQVHAVSPFVAAEVQDVFGIGAERVTVIPNGVRVPDLTAIPARVDGPPFVLAVGTVEPRKDLPLLVDAFRELADAHPELRLVLAGPDGWGADALTEAIAALPAGVRARVDRRGWVGDDERLRLQRDAAVLAYPSRYEGFGLPPLEAMALGTPVVATAAGALPETLGDAASIVPRGDRDALVDALDAVLTDRGGVASRLRRAGPDRAGAYPWARSVDLLVAEYRRLAAR